MKRMSAFMVNDVPVTRLTFRQRLGIMFINIGSELLKGSKPSKVELRINKEV